jgi:hypothetical protein
VRKSLISAIAIAAVSGLGGYGLANYAGAQGTPAAQDAPPPAQNPPDAQGAPAAQGEPTARPGDSARVRGAGDGWAARGRGENGWGARGWRYAQDRRWDQRRWMMGAQHRPWHMAKARSWGLFYPQADKKLSVADVTTLAQAILLRHGNHTWKVTDVVLNQDNTVSFAFATQGGGVIARFAMDTQTGRFRRIG